MRNVSSARSLSKVGLLSAFTAESAQIIEPFFMGCDSKQLKMVQISMAAIQKMIIFNGLNAVASANLLNCLWNLMEHGLEHVKILQTLTLLCASSQLVVNDQLARSISLCFRLYNCKNSMIVNTASATIRQLVTVIFERVQQEDAKLISESSSVADSPDKSVSESDIVVSSDNASAVSRQSFSDNPASKLFQLDSSNEGHYKPIHLRPAAMDAFNLLQDLIHLTDGDSPVWLNGQIELSKTFGLELLELVFAQHSSIFHQHQEFAFLLKEKMCQLVIKLFSPNTKQQRRHLSLSPLLTGSKSSNVSSSEASTESTITSADLSLSDKPCWSITVRLMRLVHVLIRNYFQTLQTESEIFLFLLIKSLEVDKSNWQRSIALEALYKMIDPGFITLLCKCYDMKVESCKILRDTVTALCIYIQSQFQIVDSSTTQSLIASLVNNTNGGGSNSLGSAGGLNVSASSSGVNGRSTSLPGSATSSLTGQNLTFPTFNLRGISIQLLFVPMHKVHKYRTFFLDHLEKVEPPTAPEGHGLSTALACICELVTSIFAIIETDLNCSIRFDQMGEPENQIVLENLPSSTRDLHLNMLSSTFAGLTGTFSLLLDASVHEHVTELILVQMKKLASLYGLYGLQTERNAMLLSICKSCLPSNYYRVPALNPYALNFKAEDLPRKQVDENRDKLVNSITETDINLLNLLAQQNNSLGTASANAYQTTNGLSNASGGVPSLELNSPNDRASSGSSSVGGVSSPSSSNGASSLDSSSRQIIAVGSPMPAVQEGNVGVAGTLPTASQQQAAGPVMVTSKNLQCLNALLNVAMNFGYVFDQQSWYISLTTVQHCVWILGLKPNNMGLYRLGQQQSSPMDMSNGGTSQSSSTVITNAAMTDLPMLTNMLSKLFECTQ